MSDGVLRLAEGRRLGYATLGAAERPAPGVASWVAQQPPAAGVAADDQRQLARLQADPARYRANLENFAEAGRQGARGWIDDMVAMVSDWGFRLEDVAGEVRLWHGRADRNVPAGHGEYLAAHLPNATLRWFEDAAAGHATMDLLQLVIDDLVAA